MNGITSPTMSPGSPTIDGIQARKSFTVAVIGGLSCAGRPDYNNPPGGVGARSNASLGAGKSSLCVRFVHPSHDHYLTTAKESSSVVTEAELSELTSQPGHCVYFGAAQRRVAGKVVDFHLVEHTRLRDENYRAHPSSEDYIWRATSLAISGLPRFVCCAERGPLRAQRASLRAHWDCLLSSHSQGRVGAPVEGFVLALDATLCNGDDDKQLDELEFLAAGVAAQDKEFVLALTKCDAASPEQVQRLLVKVQTKPNLRDVLTFQVSARLGVGVDDVFFGLYRKTTTGRIPRRSAISYRHLADARDEAVRLALSRFTALVKERIHAFSTTWVDFVTEYAARSGELNTNLALPALLALQGREACKKIFLDRLLAIKYSHLSHSAIYTESFDDEADRLLRACERHRDFRVINGEILEHMINAW